MRTKFWLRQIPHMVTAPTQPSDLQRLRVVEMSCLDGRSPAALFTCIRALKLAAGYGIVNFMLRVRFLPMRLGIFPIFSPVALVGISRVGPPPSGNPGCITDPAFRLEEMRMVRSVAKLAARLGLFAHGTRTMIEHRSSLLRCHPPGPLPAVAGAFEPLHFTIFGVVHDGRLSDAGALTGGSC